MLQTIEKRYQNKLINNITIPCGIEYVPKKDINLLLISLHKNKCTWPKHYSLKDIKIKFKMLPINRVCITSQRIVTICALLCCYQGKCTREFHTCSNCFHIKYNFNKINLDKFKVIGDI